MSAAMIEALGLARYLEGPLTVILTLVGPGNLPRVARGLACRITDQEMQVYLNGQDNTFLEPAPAPGTSVAIATCIPSTLQTYQFKGLYQHMRAATATEIDWLNGSIERMVIEFTKVDFNEEQARAYLAFNPDDLTVLCFSPTAVFDQTPGPNAGIRLCGGTA